MNKTNLILIFLSCILANSLFAQKHHGYKKLKSGLYYKMITKNKNAVKPEIGDIITITMVYKTNKDSVLFNSYTDPRTKDGPLRLPLEKPLYKGDFSEGLAMMGVGDSASFITSADSFFFKYANITKLPDFIESGTNLTFTIKMMNIMKKEEYDKQMEEIKKLVEKYKMEEPAKLKKYIDSNKIDVKPTTSGLYYIELKKGTGAKVKKGDKISVYYTGTLVDGTVFSSNIGNDPFEFIVGKGEVIEGWEEGLVMMNKGGKAKFIIPSSLAYTDKGAGSNIPPYTTLVFEVEIINISKP